MAKPDPIHLNIITPEHAFYDGYIDRLILPAPDGELGIEPGHEPMVISVVEGEIRVTYEKNGKPQTDIAACSAGFAAVQLSAHRYRRRGEVTPPYGTPR